MRSRSRAVCPAVLLTLISGFASSPASAGPRSLEHSLQHGAEPIWIAVALLLLGGLAVLGARRGMRTAVVSLALLVGLFGFESAIHSVHHLGDPEGAESCAISSASQHVPVTGGESPAVGGPTWRAEASAATDLATIRPLRAFCSYEGRAPPPLPFA